MRFSGVYSESGTLSETFSEGEDLFFPPFEHAPAATTLTLAARQASVQSATDGLVSPALIDGDFGPTVPQLVDIWEPVPRAQCLLR